MVASSPRCGASPRHCSSHSLSSPPPSVAPSARGWRITSTKLGTGSFSDGVFSASGGGVEVAVKVVSSMVRGAPNIVNEAAILKRLGPHRNIVAMYAHGYARSIIEGCGGLLSRLPWSYPARVPLDAYCVV